MFCIKCGAELPDGSKFCRNCGARQDGIQENNIVHSAAAPLTLKKKGTKPFIIAGVLLILLLEAITAAVFFLRGFSAESRYQEQLDLGQRYLEERDYEAAIVAFTKAIEINPKQAEPYLALADVYVEQNDYDSALEILEEGREQTGENEEIVDKLQYLSDEGLLNEGKNKDNTAESEKNQENASGYTEEELERFTAGYRAAMKYPEGKKEKLEPIDMGATCHPNTLNWIASTRSDPQSKVIDCGDYYEVTNCFIEYPYVVPDEIFDQFEEGFEFELSLYDQNGEEDTIHEIVNYVDGNWGLSDQWTPEDEYDSLGVVKEGKRVIVNRYDGYTYMGIIYRGSLYFRKDCTVHDTHFIEAETFEEYVTTDHPGYGNESWFEFGGNLLDNTMTFIGSVIFDPDTGMIVECQELYQV